MSISGLVNWPGAYSHLYTSGPRQYDRGKIGMLEHVWRINFTFIWWEGLHKNTKLDF